MGLKFFGTCLLGHLPLFPPKTTEFSEVNEHKKSKDFGLSGVLISEATDPLLQVFIALSGHLTVLP